MHKTGLMVAQFFLYWSGVLGSYIAPPILSHSNYTQGSELSDLYKNIYPIVGLLDNLKPFPIIK